MGRYCSWTQVSDPGWDGLESVWCADASHVFAVGDSTVVSGHGSSWSSEQHYGYFNCVWGSAANNVYAAGVFDNIWRFNGSSWTDTGWETRYSSSWDTFHTIWGTGPNSVYFGGRHEYEPALMLHKNGGSWSYMATPSSTGGRTVKSIWGLNDQFILAVTQDVTSKFLMFDGAWADKTSELQGTDYDDLRDVWCSSENDIYIVGSPQFSSTGKRGMILHNTPTDDNYEDNDIPSQAYDLAAQEGVTLYNIDGYGIQLDRDWFRVSVGPGKSHLRITADCLGQGEVFLQVYDNSLQYVGASDPIDQDDGQVSSDFDLPRDGTYYICVDGSGEGARYNFWWSTSASGGTLEDAMDTPSLFWTTYGAPNNWFSQTAISHDGVDAAQSGDLSDGQQSWIQTTVTGPATVSFWWKVSSEAGLDVLRFYVNGAFEESIDGEVDWRQKSVYIGPGENTLKWLYAKGGSGSFGSDCGWLDQLTVTTSPLAFAGAFDGGNNRKYLDWFGWYNDQYWPWIWDYEYGCWLWAVDNGPQNVWFWCDDQQTWMWTRTDWYKWVWYPGNPGLTWRTQ